jgi:hypothetical protein
MLTIILQLFMDILSIVSIISPNIYIAGIPSAGRADINKLPPPPLFTSEISASCSPSHPTSPSPSSLPVLREGRRGKGRWDGSHNTRSTGRIFLSYSLLVAVVLGAGSVEDQP